MRRNRKYLLDLFYGMEKDSTGNYLDDPVLSAIPGLIHKEYAATWCIPSDSVRFEMTMGIYADKSYPSDAVRNVLFRKLNTVISEGLSYDSDEKQMSLLKRGVKCNQSTDSYLRGWQNLFNKVTAMNGYNSSFSDYPVIVGSRVCVVCHKIYEDSKQATYIVEKSIDNHSSTGCPAYADYYTIDKRTGSILCLSEFLSRHKSDDIEALILKEYRMAAEVAGFRASGITGEELIRNANGVAMLGEGTLIYFHPYTIGCGAEGQYNIIIPVR